MRLDWLALCVCVCSAEALCVLHWRTGTQPERHTITLGTIFVARGSVLPHAGGGLEIPQAYPKGERIEGESAWRAALILYTNFTVAS